MRIHEIECYTPKLAKKSSPVGASFGLEPDEAAELLDATLLVDALRGMGLLMPLALAEVAPGRLVFGGSDETFTGVLVGAGGGGRLSVLPVDVFLVRLEVLPVLLRVLRAGFLLDLLLLVPSSKSSSSSQEDFRGRSELVSLYVSLPGLLLETAPAGLRLLSRAACRCMDCCTYILSASRCSFCAAASASRSSMLFVSLADFVGSFPLLYRLELLALHPRNQCKRMFSPLQ
jgi:hypothetical protein